MSFIRTLFCLVASTVVFVACDDAKQSPQTDAAVIADTGALSGDVALASVQPQVVTAQDAGIVDAALVDVVKATPTTSAFAK